MKIDLTNIPSEGKEFNFRFDKDWRKTDLEEERILGLGAPLSAWIKIQPVGKRITIGGSVSTSLLLHCDRCLEPYSWDLSKDFRIFLSLSPFNGGVDVELSEADLNLEFIQGNFLELGQVIKEQIILSLPMKTLCSAECKGLCATCGSNLNVKTCSCSKKYETLLCQTSN
ncbi:MAG TPA: DUF177 domain-containing protein [Desulfatiglandales bacterium]|nr:DUF177 domain-containing protein [Desulfatiglandales bacterium]